MIKKVLILTMVLTLALFTFVGCSKKGEAVKTGLAVISTIEKSKDAGEKDGVGEANSMVAAVTVDKNGKIVKLVIDAMQTKVTFSAEGKITTDLAKVFNTKQERKEDYGMKKASTISKEWYEQANSFADYCVGKTIAQIKDLKIDADGKPAEAELTSTVTLAADEFIPVVEKAVVNAKDVGSRSTDKLGLGITTSIGKSIDASAEKAGLAQAYSFYTATTFDKNGKVTGSIIDSTQSNVNFDTAGKITTDLATVIETKQELKERYDMKKASPIKKEWYEQANAFAEYAKGKTSTQISGMSLKAGVPAEAELTSSVTIHVTDFLTIIDKASKTAK